MTYKIDGFQVIPFLTEGQINGFRSAIGDRLDMAVWHEKVPDGKSFPGEPIERRIERIAQLDPRLAEKLLLSVYLNAHLDGRIAFLDGYRNLRTLSEDLVGGEIKSFTIRVRANIPSLPKRRQGWHSDVSVLDGGEFSKVRIACWIPLLSAGSHNGSLEVVPGKRDFPMAHNGDPDRHTIRDEDLDSHAKEVLNCNLGSAVFLDSFVPHRAIPNLSDQVRWSVVAWMMV